MKMEKSEKINGGFDPNGDSGQVETSALQVLKGALPFRLAATSYIIPADILPNVRFLGAYVDEVELVLFESAYESNLPSEETIRELNSLATGMNLTYNVHLPTDVFVGDPDAVRREKSVDTILRFMDRTMPLDPTAYILHLDPALPDGTRSDPFDESWLGNCRQSVETLLRGGVDPKTIAVESLDYPLKAVYSVVEETGLSICLDLGHMIRYGQDLERYLKNDLHRTTMIHLHGVDENGRDHKGLEHIGDDDWWTIRSYLSTYEGGLSIEVFSLDDLVTSMARIGELQT